MATLRQDLGPVTAYAYAVSEGYTGTEEEFAELMASYATVAEAAAGSASDAADSASDAEAYGAGTRGGSAVESGDEAYHNNAKYYAESAADDASTVASAVNSFTNITVPAAVQSVTDEGTTQKGLVQGEGTTQIGLVSGEGTAQVGAVEAKGAEVLESIPEDYTELSDDVSDLKSAISVTTGNTFYTYTIDKSINRLSIPTQNTEVGWESAVVECNEGDVFRVKGYGGNNTRLWMFAKSNGTVITESITALHTNEYVEIVAPADVKYLCVNSQYSQIKGSLMGGTLLREDVESLDEKMQDIDNVLSELTAISPSSIEENKIYSGSYHSGLSFNGYNTYNFAVEVGKTYYITTSVIGASGYAVCYGFKNGAWSHSYGDYPSYSGTVTDFELGVTGVEPYNIDTLKVTVTSDVTPIVKTTNITTKNIPQELGKLYKNCVKFENNEAYIKAKYDATHDIVFRINKGGGNNLPDVRYVYLVDNTGELNTDIVASRYIISNPSDVFSPSVVYANQDADGDNITSEYFTGGNHRTTNVGTGGGITAHTESFTVYCDGKVVTDWVFGNEVVVKWVNELNGYNTSKEDGTGRDIVSEEVTLTIHGAKIDVEIIHKALEPITYDTYYGLQMICSDMNLIRYYGGANRNKYNPQQASNSGDKKCRNILLANSYNDTLEIAIDPIDIGDFSKDSLSYSAFTTVSKKSYFGLLYNANLVMAENDAFVVRGYYKFMPN